MEGLILLLVVGLAAVWVWLFYLWGASIAQGKGRSRSLGWVSALFGILGIIVIALMPSDAPRAYVASLQPEAKSLADQLDRLAVLRDKGVLTEVEFEERKQALLKGA